MCSATVNSFIAQTNDYSSCMGNQNVNDKVNLVLLLKIPYGVSKLLWLNLTTVTCGQTMISLETKP